MPRAMANCQQNRGYNNYNYRADSHSPHSIGERFKALPIELYGGMDTFVEMWKSIRNRIRFRVRFPPAAGRVAGYSSGIIEIDIFHCRAGAAPEIAKVNFQFSSAQCFFVHLGTGSYSPALIYFDFGTRILISISTPAVNAIGPLFTISLCCKPPRGLPRSGGLGLTALSVGY